MRLVHAAKCRFACIACIVLLAAWWIRARPADLGNGTYRNPILFADYSDPDVIRVGSDYYLVSSSFHFVPGIPILKSHDLVNWTIIGHVYQRLELDPKYSLIGGNRYGRGSWAPAIRYRNGRFHVYFPTPDEGILVSTAKSAEGPWTPPAMVLAKPGLEDPCPLWDDDGQAYLVHSVLGAGPLILHRMNPAGTAVLDEGQVIVRDPQKLPTLEGPKFYKRNGYYYIFAPIGGVSRGPQVVLRSRSVYGPYESRVVLAQGDTLINGPHQGGYVETPSGEGWFLHFQQRGAYGRIVHLEPVRWQDDWPVIGEASPDSTTGRPVATAKKPNVGRTFPVLEPQTSDEFSGKTLGPQWEWNHNPDDAHWSLSERKGFLRLHAMPATGLLDARNTLTLMLQDPALDAVTLLDVAGMEDNQRAGLGMFFNHPHGIGVVASGHQRRLAIFAAGAETLGPVLSSSRVQLRVQVRNEAASYSYSIDGGKTFVALGQSLPIAFSWWKGARICLFSFVANQENAAAAERGVADFDWVRYKAVPPGQ
jgi:beta-xylosidase